MSEPEGHFDRFWEAIDAAKDGLAEAGPERAGQLYAQIATAHAIMHLTDVMIDIRNQLRSNS